MSKKAAFNADTLLPLHTSVIKALSQGLGPSNSSKWLKDGKAEPHVLDRIAETAAGRYAPDLLTEPQCPGCEHCDGEGGPLARCEAYARRYTGDFS